MQRTGLNAREIFGYSDKDQRDQDFEISQELLKPKTKGKTNMMEKIKEYWDDHSDWLFPLLVIMALDFFFNDGRFQKKITNVINGMLESVTSRFEKKSEAMVTKELGAGHE